MTMLLCMALSVLGAYALSNLRWPGRNLFGLFLLVTQMLPEILILIPLYIIYRRLNMLNSIPSLALIDAAFILPICIWILKGVFDNVPPEVLDASVVDGCTELSALWRIVLPLSAPGLAAVAVVAFFFAWNEYLYAGIMLSSGEFMPASVGLSTLKAIAQTPGGTVHGCRACLFDPASRILLGDATLHRFWLDSRRRKGVNAGAAPKASGNRKRGLFIQYRLWRTE